METRDLGLNNLFTKDGTDVWGVESFCLGPTVTLKNLKTGEKERFGIGGGTSNSFKKIFDYGEWEKEKVR